MFTIIDRADVAIDGREGGRTGRKVRGGGKRADERARLRMPPQNESSNARGNE